MDEIKDVQQDEVSKETSLPKGEESKEETPQPLTEERIQQIVAEQVEQGKREIQSVKDRARLEIENAERRARLAESDTAGYRTGFENLDEDSQEKAELARLRGRNDYFMQQRQEEEARRAAMETYDTFKSQMTQFATSMGVDPKDIDWGDNTESLMVKQQRILTSVGTKQKSAMADMETRLRKEIKDTMLQADVDAGVHSQESSNAKGSGDSGSDAVFKKGLGDGSITLRGKEGKVNLERAKNLGLAK